MSRDLEEKTALVTGGGRGIGKAIARRLAASGALVAVNYASNGEAANQTVAEIEAAGGKAFAIRVELGSEIAARELASKACAEFQRRRGTDRVDIIVNNVGGGDYGRLTDTTQEHYDRMISNNCRSGFFVIKAFYDRINDNGRIINISSVGARLTDPNIIVYTMAKAAVDAFTRVLAAELGPRGITVNAVAPGFTAGETNQHVLDDPAMAKTVIDNTALRRFGQPDEIADMVHALASRAGRWITAQTIDASGGFKL